MSCGGTQAYARNRDTRVSAFGIFNSGTFEASQTEATLGAINVPIFFFLGGPRDIAYQNVSIIPSLVYSSLVALPAVNPYA